MVKGCTKSRFSNSWLNIYSNNVILLITFFIAKKADIIMINKFIKIKKWLKKSSPSVKV